MIRYIALLRGINVGGRNIIKMADLKRVLESIGLASVKTYIQSGNVLFKSEGQEEPLRKEIEQEIEKIFGFHVTVVLRTAAEIEWIIQNCPFSNEEIIDAEKSSKVESLYVSLLTHVPSEEKIKLLNSYASEIDKYKIEGREVFLLLYNSVRNSKLANNLKKLEVPGTVRNFKTMNKLNELAKAL